MTIVILQMITIVTLHMVPIVPIHRIAIVDYLQLPFVHYRDTYFIFCFRRTPKPLQVPPRRPICGSPSLDVGPGGWPARVPTAGSPALFSYGGVRPHEGRRGHGRVRPPA